MRRAALAKMYAENRRDGVPLETNGTYYITLTQSDIDELYESVSNESVQTPYYGCAPVDGCVAMMSGFTIFKRSE